MAGIGMLAACEEERLTRRFTRSFVRQARNFFGERSLSWWNLDNYAIPVGEGGFYAAFWSLAEELGCGFEIDQLRIPIRQETVEISEVLGINPPTIRNACRIS